MKRKASKVFTVEIVSVFLFIAFALINIILTLTGISMRWFATLAVFQITFGVLLILWIAIRQRGKPEQGDTWENPRADSLSLLFVLFVGMSLLNLHITSREGEVRKSPPEITCHGAVLQPPSVETDNLGNAYKEYICGTSGREQIVRVPLTGSSYFLDNMKHKIAETSVLEEPDIGETLCLRVKRLSLDRWRVQIGTATTNW